MCGIAGIVDVEGRALDGAALARMSASMRLRGPDDEGTWSDGVAMLGFRRLSIIDLDGGHQPMSTPDGQLTVVFNGEVYNFRELRSRLQSLGHHFATGSDTEAILHAYRAWGDDGVRELDGMFAFALWDAPRRRLLLGRDRFGKKPLYYFHDGRRLVFASTLSALVEHPQVPRALDEDALAEYLALEYVVAPRTMLAGVRKLEPATLYAFDAASGRAEKRRYWSLRVDGAAHLDEHEAAAELERRLRAAVKKRLVADVPLGVFLSGGIDSSTVTALAAAERSGIRTFSVRFSDPSFDEGPFARRVAAHLGTSHVEEELSLGEAAAIVERLGEILDEPVADGSVVPTYLLSRFARRHVTVALGGDGGDELFAGYPTYAAHRLASFAGPLARPSLVARMRQLAARLPVSHDNFSFDFKLKKLLAGLDAPLDERNYVWLGAFERERLGALFGREVDPYRAVRARYHDGAGTHLERVLYQDVGLYMCHSVLAKVDRASMAASLEVRAPLLDTAVAELAGALPLSLKLRRLTGKYLLKRVARRFLPSEIVDRPKKGFGMPTGRWLRAELGALARDALTDGSSLAAEGLLARAEVERLLDEHTRGTADHRQRLWALLVLELWRRQLRRSASSGEHSMTSSQPSALQVSR
jgi:asparagine synthase (glutamine-hydrolysing)